MYLQKVKIRKNSFLLASWRSMTKIAQSGAGSWFISQMPGSGSVPKCHGSATLEIILQGLSEAVLLIRDVYPGSRIRIFSIVDPGSEFFPPRIPNPHQKYFNPKNCFLSSRKYDSGCSSRIRIPDPDPQHYSEVIFPVRPWNRTSAGLSVEGWPVAPHPRHHHHQSGGQSPRCGEAEVGRGWESGPPAPHRK